MKKLILSLLVIFSIKFSSAQIPNSDFENWTITPLWEELDGWTSFYGDFVVPCISKDTDSYSGSFAAYFNNFSIPSYAYTSFPLSAKPGLLRAFVKANVAAGDSIYIRVVLYHSSEATDSGKWVGYSNLDNYTEVTIPISQNNPDADSALVDIRGGNNSNTDMLVDNLSLDFSSQVPRSPLPPTLSFSASPNPFSDFLQFNINSSLGTTISMRLFNDGGKAILQFGKLKINEGENTMVLPTQNLPSGVYHCIFYYGAIHASLRLLKVD